jgi:MoxR-like ATPase
MSFRTLSREKDASMFETAKELSEKLSETGYFIDPTMTKVVFLAAGMQKPLLLEGPPAVARRYLLLHGST